MKKQNVLEVESSHSKFLTQFTTGGGGMGGGRVSVKWARLILIDFNQSKFINSKYFYTIKT